MTPRQHHAFLFLFCQFKEPGHAWQARKMIVIRCFYAAFLIQGIAEGFIQGARTHIPSLGIGALISIPYLCQSGAILHKDVFTHGMYDGIAPVSLIFGTIYNLISAPFGGKYHRRIRDTSHVIRMNSFVHIVVHIIVCLCPVIISKKITKPL